jgi:glycosyltransferase involved in cell wall biosynthesis
MRYRGLMMRVVVLTKRQYTNKDVIDDQYGRLWEIPLGLAREGHHVTCVCLSYRTRKSEHSEFGSDGGPEVRWISVNLGTFVLFGLLKYLWVANKVIRDEKPDFIWSCSDTVYSILGYFFAKAHRCRSIADLYDNFESFGSFRVPILNLLFRYVVRHSDGVSCVSERLLRHVTDSYRRKKNTTVITNAINTRVFHPIDKAKCREKLGLPQDVVLIGTAGDLSDHRGADTMLQAILKFPDELDNIHFAVAGYRHSDTKIPVRNNIHDLGLMAPNDVPLLINSLDLAVVYNRSSLFGDFCFPQKFYEILACQIPMVAADVGELSLILHDKPHLLYNDGNLDSILGAILRQLERRELLDFVVPTWDDQARLLLRQMNSLLTDA